MITLEQLRSVVSPYLSDKTGLVDIPANLSAMLEDMDDNADESAKSIVESIEGTLALYAVNRISRDSLKERLDDLLGRNKGAKNVHH